MSLICFYFAAPSDVTAARAVDSPEGPGRAAQVARTVPGRGVEPVVQLGMLHALLTDSTFDAVLAQAPRQPVALRDGGERSVLRVADGLCAALSDSSDQRLADLAEPWSRIEEFDGRADPSDLADLLRELRALARDTRRRGEGLYCWISV